MYGIEKSCIPVLFQHREYLESVVPGAPVLFSHLLKNGLSSIEVAEAVEELLPSLVLYLNHAYETFKSFGGTAYEGFKDYQKYSKE